MNYWHELDLTDWMKWQEQGDYFLPFRPYLRKLAAADISIMETLR